jgi:hypothetical protein
MFAPETNFLVQRGAPPGLARSDAPRNCADQQIRIVWRSGDIAKEEAESGLVASITCPLISSVLPLAIVDCPLSHNLD